VVGGITPGSTEVVDSRITNSPGRILRSPSRRHDIAHVRVLGLAQRGRDGDIDRIQVSDDGEILGGAKSAGIDKRAQGAGGDARM